MKPRIEIPFVAKRPANDQPWQEFGGTESEYHFWTPHICSIACIRSLILATRKTAPSLWNLTKRATEIGVFKEGANQSIEGAFHAPLVELLKEFGLDASVFGRLTPDEVWELAEQGVLLLSIDLAAVRNKLFGSHMVLVVARGQQQLIIHDSACVLCENGNACRISRSMLNAISNGRGIFVPWNAFLDCKNG
jgi:hypothetical protein